ncbi:MAG: hypothetical protein WCK47_06170 [bacterium]|nr:hypothetical protein [Candidatus Sumerlaeota bacterium]
MRAYAFVFAIILIADWGCSQTLAEMNAVQAGQNTLNAGSVTGGLNPGLPGQIAGGMAPTGAMPQPGAGLAAPMGYPGASPMGYPGAPMGGMPGLGPGMGMMNQQPGMQGQTGMATPIPVPTIQVLVGKRVYDAVTGAIIEDAMQLTVPESDKDKYYDDGSRDNGVAGDNIRGNVETIRGKYISPETNAIKNRMITVVRKADVISPLHFSGYYVVSAGAGRDKPDVPTWLELEKERDEFARDWNNKFLANYRADKNDPRSEFFQIYVPEPPQIPKYPVPYGYTSPQQRFKALADQALNQAGGGVAGGGMGAMMGPGAGGKAGGF